MAKEYFCRFLLHFSFYNGKHNRVCAEKRTIVVMGSSSAYGWKSRGAPDSAWVGRLQKDLHYYGRGDTIINIAFPGNTTFACLPTGAPYAADGYPSDPAYNVTNALSFSPTFVIISLPTNDIRNGYSNAEILANYTTITNALTAAGVPFIPNRNTTQGLSYRCRMQYSLRRRKCMLVVRFNDSSPTDRLGYIQYSFSCAIPF